VGEEARTFDANLRKILEDNHSLAATLAARHIRACAISAAHIDDWHSHDDHETWLAPLMEQHSRKFGVSDHV
jgi:hypothetical protein